MDAEQDGGGLEIGWGIEVSGTIVNGGRATIPPAQIGEFRDFFGMAKANRTP